MPSTAINYTDLSNRRVLYIVYTHRDRRVHKLYIVFMLSRLRNFHDSRENATGFIHTLVRCSCVRPLVPRAETDGRPSSAVQSHSLGRTTTDV